MEKMTKEDILLTIDQLDQTLEVMALVVKRLKYNVNALSEEPIENPSENSKGEIFPQGSSQAKGIKEDQLTTSECELNEHGLSPIH